MRYERKYLIEKNNDFFFKNFLLRNNFQYIYEKRKVNSIYFDTNDFKFFEENINGVSQRKKVRLRWYNDEIDKLIIEIKNKKGFLGWKDNHRINNLENNLKINEFYKKKNYFKNIKVFNKFNLKPVIKVSYLREYFQSFCQKFRATVDTNLQVSVNLSDANPKFNLQKDIMEFKYDYEKDETFRNFLASTNFKFRFQKFSKYVSGILFLKKNFLI